MLPQIFDAEEKIPNTWKDIKIKSDGKRGDERSKLARVLSNGPAELFTQRSILKIRSQMAAISFMRWLQMQ
jgi:hypothetical protein